MAKSIEGEYFPEVVLSENKEWKKVPGFIRTYATSEGSIGRLVYGKFIRSSIVEQKTTKGSYKYAAMVGEPASTRHQPVHRLVALAFHGIPPVEPRHEADHLNGDKHDNRASNLEWVTHSENIKRAFASGLCQVGIRIKAKNVITGEVKSYNSLSGMAAEWNLPRRLIKFYIHYYKEIPLNGIWLFEADDSSDRLLERHQVRDVIFKDYITGNVTIVKSVDEAASITGILPATICSKINKVSKKYLNLIGQYVFQDVDAVEPWPVYSQAEAKAARDYYFRKAPFRQFLRTNVHDGEKIVNNV